MIRWYDRAACGTSDVDPGIFVPTNGLGPRQQWRKAREMCKSCPVTDECLEEALGIDELPVWQNGRAFAMFQAGHTPAELTRLYNNQKESRQAA